MAAYFSQCQMCPTGQWIKVSDPFALPSVLYRPLYNTMRYQCAPQQAEQCNSVLPIDMPPCEAPVSGLPTMDTRRAHMCMATLIAAWRQETHRIVEFPRKGQCDGSMHSAESLMSGLNRILGQAGNRKHQAEFLETHSPLRQVLRMTVCSWQQLLLMLPHLMPRALHYSVHFAKFIKSMRGSLTYSVVTSISTSCGSWMCCSCTRCVGCPPHPFRACQTHASWWCCLSANGTYC